MAPVWLLCLGLAVIAQQAAAQCTVSADQTACLANPSGCFWCGSCYSASISGTADFPSGCTSVQGSLTITGSTFTSLDVLKDVQSVSECLVIQGTTALVTASGMTSINGLGCLTIKDNANLETVSKLGSLNTFSKPVILQNNPKLANLVVFRDITSFQALTIDNTGIYNLSDFAQVNGVTELTIQNCARLADLTGCTNSPSISVKLLIKNNAILNKPDGLINQLAGVVVLQIEANPVLESISVTLKNNNDIGTLIVKDNPNLLTIDGRKHGNMARLEIVGNRRLTSLGIFLSELNSLQNGALIRNNMALQSFALPKIGSTTELTIDSNVNLQSVTFNELQQLSGTDGKLQITDNRFLQQINIPKLDNVASAGIQGNTNLVSLTLSVLRALNNGDLLITDNSFLETITMPVLYSGSVYIQDNPRLATITANALQQPSILAIYRNPSLTTISCTTLAYIGSLYIEDNDWLTSISLPLQQASFRLRIKGNYNLQTISLPSFTTAQDEVTFENNPSLTTLSLPAFTTVNLGALTVKNNRNLTTFNPGLTRVGGLVIQDNPQLVTLGQFSGLSSGFTGALVLENNPRLVKNVADMTAWTNLQSGSGVVSLTISGASLCCAGITAMANRIGFNGYTSPLCDASSACGGSSAAPTIPPVPAVPTAPAPAPNTPVRCGSGYGYCASGCCSAAGYCSDAAANCGPGCQAAYGYCIGCGPIATTSCSSGCCSIFGFCGTTPDFCDTSCQVGWGQCNGFGPAAVSSTVVSSTVLSSTAVSSTAALQSSTYQSSTFPSSTASASSSVVSSTYQSSTAPSSTVASSTFPSSSSSSSTAAAVSSSVSSTVPSSSAPVSSSVSSSAPVSSTYESSTAPQESSSTAEPVEEVVVCGSGAYPVGDLCEPCAVNTYSPEGLACLPCPANSHTDFGGSPSRSECICNAAYGRSDIEDDENFTCIKTIELPPATQPPPLGQKSVRFTIVICSLSHLPLINATLVGLGVNPARLSYQSFLSNGTLAAYVDIGPPLAAFPDEKSAAKVYEDFAMMIARKSTDLPTLCASSAVSLIADTDTVVVNPPAPPSSSSSVYSSTLFIGLISGIIGALCIGLAVGIWIRQSHKRKREVYVSSKTRRSRTAPVLIREKTKGGTNGRTHERGDSEDKLLPGQAPIHVHVHVTPAVGTQEEDED